MPSATMIAGGLCCLSMVAGASGQAAIERDAGGDPPQYQEQPDDPYVPPRIDREVAPPVPVMLGPFAAVQVNTDAMGNNIMGDAANEPSIAVDPTAPNRIVIGWRQFDTVESNFRQAGWAWSHDGGRTWTFPGVLEPGVFRSDPVLDVNRAGRFYYYSLRSNFQCDMFISDDHGGSWFGPFYGYGGDKAWIAVDRSGGAGDGHVYAAWSTSAGCCDIRTFTRSVNGGTVYSNPIEIVQRPIWGTLAVGPAGELYVSGRNPNDTSDFIVTRSSDVSNPFLPPSFDLSVNVDLGGAQVLGGAPNPGGLCGQAYVAKVQAADDLYLLCSVNPPGGDPLDVRFAASRDGGASWEPSVRVNDDPGPPFMDHAWQWFGTMSVAPGGRVDAVWLDTRDSGLENVCRLYHAASSDGGRTWSDNMPLSPAFDSHLGWPQQNKMGDYFHMVSDDVGAHLAWAATFNGEQDVYYLRIGDYDCNGNGIGDAEDLLSGTSPDCNRNGLPDSCEVAAGTVSDDDGNGIPDACEIGCPWDLDGDGFTTTTDLLALLAGWGVNPGHPADFDGDGVVGMADLEELLLHWGVC